MVKLWDKYGVWVAVCVLLTAYTPPVFRVESLESAALHLYLTFNLTLTIATVYQFLMGRWNGLRIWGPRVSRWIARWMGYTVIGMLFGGLVFSVFGLILAPVIAMLITIIHVTEDLSAARP
jgi:hypothetical protein